MTASRARSATVFTHQRPDQTGAALEALLEVARAEGVVLRFDADETRKHGLAGGDGTILRALRHYAGTGVPVFAVNFGQIGFLATIDPEECALGFASSGLPGPKGNRESFVRLAEAGRAGDVCDALDAAAGEVEP